jgi:hypothetical protein
MNPIINQPQLHITGMRINEIIFDESNFARIKGEALAENELHSITLCMEFGQLNDYLRFSGEAGDTALQAMVDALENTETPPYSIDVAALLGKKNIFTQCEITITATPISTSLLEYYEVVELNPINLIQQSKNLQVHLKHFGFAQLTQQLKDKPVKSMAHLRTQYAYYLGLLELDIREDAAREKAQIVDERLFNMAKKAFTNSSDYR